MTSKENHRLRLANSKSITATVMLVAIAIQIFWNSGFLVDYYTNTEAYKELCINKDKPKLNCDGKCILAQKIAASDQSKNQQEDAALPPIPVISSQYVISVFSMVFNTHGTLIIHNWSWREPSLQSLVFSILKPPI